MVQKRRKKPRAIRRPLTVYRNQLPEDGDTIDNISSVLNLYYKIYDRKDYKEFLLTWLKKNQPQDYKLVKDIHQNWFPVSLCTCADLLNRQCILTDHETQWFYERLKKFLDPAYLDSLKESKDESDDSDLRRKAKMQAQRDDFIGSLEELFDSFIVSDYSESVSIAPIFIDKSPNNELLKFCIDYYDPILRESKAIAKDRDLKEAYGHLTTKQLRSRTTFLQEVISTAQQALDNKKRVRKPRIKKAKKASEIVRNLKYLSFHKDLNVSSLPPEKLVDSLMIVLYNTKDRRVMVFYAGEEKLTIRGTTIHNYDPDRSFSIKIRKPDETVSALTKATKREVSRILGALSTVQSPASTGRINDNCLIISTF